MALAPCRECGTDISSEAASCPKCGVPNPQGSARPSGEPAATGPGVGKIAAGTFTGLVGCLVVPSVLGFILLILLLVWGSCA